MRSSTWKAVASLLELAASSSPQRTMMGETLLAAAGVRVHFKVHAVHVPGARLQVLLDGQPFASAVDVGIDGADQRIGCGWKCATPAASRC